MPFVCLVPGRLFSALQYGGIAPHEWITLQRAYCPIFLPLKMPAI